MPNLFMVMLGGRHAHALVVRTLAVERVGEYHQRLFPGLQRAGDAAAGRNRDDGPDADQQDQAHHRRQHGGPEIARFPAPVVAGGRGGLELVIFQDFFHASQRRMVLVSY